MILAAATISLIEKLQEFSSGWRFEPLVVTADDKLKHQGFVSVRPKPKNISPTDFLLSQSEDCVRTNFSLIKCNKKNVQPRIVELRLAQSPVPVIELYYWLMNGWNQTKPPIRRFYNQRHVPKQEKGLVYYKVFQMERVTKATNHRHRGIIHRDLLHLSDDISFATVAQTVTHMLEKSLQKPLGSKKQWNRYELEMAVVMNGKNFLYDCGRIRCDVVRG